MEGQGKRLLLAVALALGIVVLWNYLFPNKSTPKKPIPDATGQVETHSSPVGIPTGSAEAPVAAAAQEDITAFDYPGLVHVEFSSIDAKVKSWQLLDPKYARDWHKGELIALK